MIVRHKRNKICAVKNVNVWLSKVEEIANFFLDNFQLVYALDILTISDCLGFFSKPLIIEENLSLLRILQLKRLNLYMVYAFF